MCRFKGRHPIRSRGECFRSLGCAGGLVEAEPEPLLPRLKVPDAGRGVTGRREQRAAVVCRAGWGRQGSRGRSAGAAGRPSQHCGSTPPGASVLQPGQSHYPGSQGLALARLLGCHDCGWPLLFPSLSPLPPTGDVHRPHHAIVPVEAARALPIVRPPEVDFAVLAACDQQVPLPVEPAAGAARPDQEREPASHANTDAPGLQAAAATPAALPSRRLCQVCPTAALPVGRLPPVKIADMAELHPPPRRSGVPAAPAVRCGKRRGRCSTGGWPGAHSGVPRPLMAWCTPACTHFTWLSGRSCPARRHHDSGGA